MQNTDTNLEDFGKRAVRHGEVMLIPVEDVPAEAKVFEGNSYIVAHSETGHHHVAVGDIQVWTFGNETFLRAVKDSKIEHRKEFEKHETKPLLKGWFKVVVKQSYDYFKKRMENVCD